MLYKKYCSIPANTAEETPDWKKLKVCKGTIKQWIIFFDPEAADLLHVRVAYHGTQILPFGGKDWLVAFFTDTPLDDNIEITEKPYELDIYAYNEDDTFPHEYYIHPIIIREEPLTLPTPRAGTIERFKKLFGGL